MRSAHNPFNPGSGLRPPALVGRDSDLQMFDDIVERVEVGMPNRGIVLIGLRGVGKTVLLNEMQRRAEDAGWFAVAIEGRPDDAGAQAMRARLARSLQSQARALAVRRSAGERLSRALSSVKAFSAKVGVTGVDMGVDLVAGRADSGHLDVDLPELVEDVCSALDGVGLAFFIDEMHDVDDSLLSALIATQHEAGQRGWPFYIIGAGLPTLPGLLSENHSYSERLFDYRRIGPLKPPDDARALVEPVHSAKAEFTAEALQILLNAARGYPYFLQEYGKAAWAVAPTPEIGALDAEQAVIVGREALDDGFFASRWSRATPSERKFLVAMAADSEGPSKISDVAARLQVGVKSLGPRRASLIVKGLIYAPEHGNVAYTVPGMAEYANRNRDDA